VSYPMIGGTGVLRFRIRHYRRKRRLALRTVLLSLIGAMALSSASFADPLVIAPSTAPTSANSPVTAPQPAAQPQTTAPQTAAVDPEADEVVCRHEAPPTGTRLGGHTVCHKRSEWQAMEADSQKTLNNLQQNGLLSQNNNSRNGGGK
jgi:hypothetical protein